MDDMQTPDPVTTNPSQSRTVTDCVPSTSSQIDEAVTESVTSNVSSEESLQKRKTRRGRKNSKVKDSENCDKANHITEDVNLGIALGHLSLSNSLPEKELEAFLNSNGRVKAKKKVDKTLKGSETSGEVSGKRQEEATVSTPSQNENSEKKKKKSKKKAPNSAQASPIHSSNTGTHKNQSNQVVRSPNAQHPTPKGDSAASCKKKPYSKSSSTPKESNAFPKYLPSSEVMSGLASGALIGGVLRINQRNYKEAYISSPDKGQDIMIEGMRNRNRALEGDEIVVRLNPESEWKVQGSKKQKTAMVVYIRTKVHARVGVGFLKTMPDGNKDFALFSPRDSRIPRMRIPIAQCPENFLKQSQKYKNSLFLAIIRDWQDVRYAMGDIIQEIGVCGDIKTETVAILMENDIEFSPYDVELYQYFPRSPFQISEEEIASREDLREECIFTIDPLTAKDLDDAVSCVELENGNFKIGVHISDVSYFLKEGTPLDEAVSKKATSTYLVETVYHMLPKEMCLMCSLLPGQDKLAFSVFWEITPDAEVLSHYFTRSVINSCNQLAYEHAQIMIENPDKEWSKDELPRLYGKHTAKDLSRVVNHLNRLAIIMRSRRFTGGALRIDQPKLCFSLESGTGLPQEYTVYVNKECHRLIEEFMLLANMTVATRLNSDFPDLAFLRCHPSPLDYIMQELQKSMEQRGIFLDITSAGTLQSSMWRYSGDDFISNARMLVLNSLCAKPMARAKYFCTKFASLEEDFWHYALNVPLYTHFTSPIRRYADIMVHRLLCASLEYAPRPTWNPDDVQAVASNCNKQKYQAKRAGEQSIELYLAVYIGLHSPMVEEAVVMDVKDLSFDVIVCNTGMVQRVYTNNLPAPAKVKCRVEENKIIAQEIEWLPTEVIPYGTLQVVEIFSIVTVELSRSSVTLKVEARLLRPPRSGAFPT